MPTLQPTSGHCCQEACPTSAIAGSGSRLFFGPTCGFSTDLRMSLRTNAHVGQGHSDHRRANPSQQISGSSCLIEGGGHAAFPHDQNDVDRRSQGRRRGTRVAEVPRQEPPPPSAVPLPVPPAPAMQAARCSRPTERAEPTRHGQRRRSQGLFKDLRRYRSGHRISPRGLTRLLAWRSCVLITRTTVSRRGQTWRRDS